MNFDWKKLGAYCGIFGGIVFIIITAVIMVIYPGGYNFVLNTFSSLGLSVTNSVPTPHHWFLFAFACTFVAVCSILFFFTIRTLFTEPKYLFYLAWVGTILGILAAFFLSGLAIFAGDVFPSEHGRATLAFFLLISIAIVIYTIGIFLNKDYENLYGLIGIIIAILSFTYFIGMFISEPTIGSAAMQKVAVYGLILWSVFQGYKLFKIFK
jgi:hypothetical protein